jgi:hypothetical protein
MQSRQQLPCWLCSCKGGAGSTERTWDAGPGALRGGLHICPHLLQAVEVELGVLAVVVLVLCEEASVV